MKASSVDVTNVIREFTVSNETKNQIEDIFNLLEIPEGSPTPCIEDILVLLKFLLGKYEEYVNDDFIDSGFRDWLKEIHERGRSRLMELAITGNTIDQKLSAFKALLSLLPSQSVLGRRSPSFPNQFFGEVLQVIISTEGDISYFLNELKAILEFDDVSQNIWKALEIALCKLNKELSITEVNNFLQIMSLIEKPSDKRVSEYGPILYFCRVQEGLLSSKEISTCIRKFWERIIMVDLKPKMRQALILTLYEKLMPRMEKPIFLTDYFMSALEMGGAISLLALQGIFTLIQKYNMNYPNVYKKLYAMLSPDIFATSYKSRFYYLTDMFLMSSHLPETLVAGFVKKFARLSLVAPPPDALIMMTFIVNLIIRHPGLKKLINNNSTIEFNSDPYNVTETDPSASGAIDSSLWEVQILQEHCLPRVSAAAMFINQPLPTVERDLSLLLELTSKDIFEQELKKKSKEVPVSFEKPSSFYMPGTKSGMALWEFSM